MRLSGHQPVYLPGIIVFTKIALSDAFMYVPHCQFVSKSWHSRNYIRGVNDQPIMLTVPIEKSMGQSIAETKIMEGNWRRKHVETIKQVYRHRPYFADYFSLLSFIIQEADDLCGLNMRLMAQIIAWLGLKTKCVDSRQYGIAGSKTAMLISMCYAVKADEYLSNPGETYVDRGAMAAYGIAHHFLKFTHPVYDQGPNKEFLPNLSIIDLLFNCGPEAARIVKNAGNI